MVDQKEPAEATRVLIKSPTAEMLNQRHIIQHEQEVYDNTWQSCCLTLDKRACMYFTQTSVIIFIMTFCIYQLINLNPCESQPYLGLLTLVLGLLIPSPQMDQNK